MTSALTLEKSLVGAALLALLAAVYSHTFVIFVQGWHQEENMHGVAVVPLVAFLLWMNWARLRKTPIHPNMPWGLGILGAALFVQVAGIWLGLERSICYSFVFAVVGLCLYCLGTQMTRELAFPLAFLLFMVPTPGGVLDMISAPLQLVSARMAVALAGLSGVMVQNEGVNLLIPAKHIAFEVAVACSGLHSLTAMCMLAALMAYFITVPLRWKWALFALAIPLALLGNILRIYLVLMVANSYGQAAGSAFHDGLIGKLFPFTLAFFVLMGLGRLIEWRLGQSKNTPPPPPALPVSA
jgi:exosortase